MNEEYHTQTVRIGLKKDSDLYRSIVEYAEREGATVAAVVDTLITLGSHRAMREVLRRLNTERSSNE